MTSFDEMLISHPKHVFKITDEKHATQLFEEGRLADETVVVAPTSGSSVRKGDRDDLAPMKLVRVTTPHAPKPKVAKGKLVGAAKAAAPKAALAKPIKGTKYLVWESKPLVERDLNIPKGENTNPTGSMGLKKGLYEEIDRKHPANPSVNYRVRPRRSCPLKSDGGHFRWKSRSRVGAGGIIRRHSSRR